MKKFWKKASAKAGFTLVELVVVIAVLAILAAVAYPAYTGYIQRANDSKIQGQVSGLLVAIESAQAVAGNTDTLKGVTIDSNGDITVDGVTLNKTIGDAISEFTNKSVTYNDSEKKLHIDINFGGTSYNGIGIQWTSDTQSWDPAPTP